MGINGESKKQEQAQLENVFEFVVSLVLLICLFILVLLLGQVRNEKDALGRTGREVYRDMSVHLNPYISSIAANRHL